MVLQTEGGGIASAGPRWVRRDLALGVVAVLLLCAVALLTRGTGQLRPLVVTVALALALACFGLALARPAGRRAPLALGAGLLAWAMGGIALSLQSVPTTPSVADLFSLLFYPLAAVAVILLVRPELQHRKASVWLDAAVAALGAATIWSGFALHSVVRVSGSPASVAVGLAYPLGDVVLLALALGLVVVAPRHPGRTVLFALGAGLMALGGMVSLHQLSPSALQAGAPLDLLAPAAMIAMTGSLWLRSRHRQRAPQAEKALRLGILALVVLACPVVLVLGNLRPGERHRRRDSPPRRSSMAAAAHGRLAPRAAGPQRVPAAAGDHR